MTRCKIKRRSDNPVCRKSMFLKQTSNSLPLSPCPLSPGKGDFTGATAPDQARMLAVSRTKPLHDAVAQMADDLYGGFAPKQGRFGCLPKVLHDAKPTKQATLDTPFLHYFFLAFFFGTGVIRSRISTAFAVSSLSSMSSI